MALVWADPFDQYGTATGANSFMLNAGYSDVNVSGWGGGRTNARGPSLFNAAIRRPLDAVATTLGQGAAVFPNGISGDSSTGQGIRFESAGKVRECYCTLLTDNSIGVWDRNNTLLGKTAPNTIIPGSYQWVEAKCVGNIGGANTGTVEVRIQGITQEVVNGINLPNPFAFHSLGGSANGQATWDDYIVWDNTGADNNDFMGDRRLFISYTNANLALQDFVPSAGQAWDCLNNSPPVDTTYVEGAAAGNVSEFGKDLIGINSTDVAAVVIFGRLLKSDAGVASGRLGINSNGFVSNSPEKFPGTTGSLFNYIIERDPNGNIHWAKAAVDAAALRLTRQS